MPDVISRTLFGEPNHIGIERGIAEFRAHRPVLIEGRDERAIAMPVDRLDAEHLQAFAAFCAPSVPRLAVTMVRGRALGIDAICPSVIDLTPGGSVEEIMALATSPESRCTKATAAAGSATAAALELAKLARRLPAVMVAVIEALPAVIMGAPLVAIDADAVRQFRKAITHTLKIAGEAQIPLPDGVAARFVVFSDAIGDESVAVIVKQPDFTKPVPVRLHSACLTGDVFGSRRCDCGDQLKLAIAHLVKIGGGIILYLDQEGRGLGLANKMLAYKLQDAGLDTVDANTMLGFDDDERDYGAAARMLQVLGCTRVQLLTNNPAKIDGLTTAGVEISGRTPLVAPVSRENLRYLTAKATRAGHSFDQLLETLVASE